MLYLTQTIFHKQFDDDIAHVATDKHQNQQHLNLVSRSSGFLVFQILGIFRFVQESLRAVAIITVPPYTFVIGRCREQFFIDDTHRIGQNCDGNGGGIVKVFSTTKSVMRWVWERLCESGIRAEYQQVIDVNACCQSPVQDSEVDVSAFLDSIIIQSISPLQPLEASKGSSNDSVVDNIAKNCTISEDSSTSKLFTSRSQLKSQIRDRENELAFRIRQPDEKEGSGNEESKRCMSTNTVQISKVGSKKAGPQLYDDLAYP